MNQDLNFRSFYIYRSFDMLERLCVPLPVILVVSYVISNYNVINLETLKCEDSIVITVYQLINEIDIHIVSLPSDCFYYK